jgi:PPOX class probable FMN-dependent enzyme
MQLPRWRESLMRSLELMRNMPEATFFQMANAYTSGSDINDIVVENRTLVFRGFADDSQTLLAITDSRTDKIMQLHKSNTAHICWYFTQTREQYRISTEVSLINAELSTSIVNDHEKKYFAQMSKLRNDLWSSLSTKAKQQFYWAKPKALIDANFTQEEVTESIPDNFTMLCFHPYYLDYLNLTTTPQTREIHQCKGNNWHYTPVNA